MNIKAFYSQTSAKRIVFCVLCLMFCLFIINYMGFLTVYKERFVNYLKLHDIEQEYINTKVGERIYGVKEFLYISLSVLLSIISVSLVLCTGSVIFGYKLKFKSSLWIVLVATFIFVIEYLAEFLYLLILRPELTSMELMGFTLFSLLQLFDINTVPSHFIYALQTINLWEILFCFALAFGLSKSLNESYWKTLRFAFVVYGGALSLWILTVMCLNLFLN